MRRSSLPASTRWAVALFVVLLVAACGSGASSILDTVGNSVGGAGAPSAGPAAPVPGAEQPEGEGRPDGEVLAVRDGAKIVYSGSLSLQVGNLEEAVAAGTRTVDGLGGYVAASRRANDGEESTASFTYRIPADRWEDGLAALRGLGTVVGEQTDAAEVTSQLVDLEARIRNLRASETALQRIAEQATLVEDILDVERRLTEVRGQIEQLDAQRANLEDQAAYGTLNVTYGRVIVAVVQAAEGWDPAGEVDRATASLVDILQAVTTAGIWFAIVWLPILLAIVVILVVGRFVLRRMGVLGSTA